MHQDLIAALEEIERLKKKIEKMKVERDKTLPPWVILPRLPKLVDAIGKQIKNKEE